MSNGANVVRSGYWLADPDQPLIGRYRAMPYPEHWESALLKLWQHNRENPDRFRTIPTRRIEGVLQALAPDLVIPSHPPQLQPDQEPDPYWLYSDADRPDPLPGNTLLTLCTAWLRDLRQEPEYLELISQTLVQLHENPPKWQENVEIDLMGCPVTSGGTARPYHRQFRLATDRIARAILDLGPYPYNNGRQFLHFRAVPRGYFERGAELISDPLKWSADGRDFWWSIYLNISLQTVPFSPALRLHLSLGTRRWATRPSENGKSLYLPQGQQTTVYLRPEVPWLPGAPLSERYGLARLCWDRKSRSMAWKHGDCAAILGALSSKFPAAQSILSDSESWIDGSHDVQAMVVHNTRMGSHGVGAGLMPNQRSEIIEWAESALTAAGLARLPDLRRSKCGDNLIRNAPPSKFPTSHDKAIDLLKKAIETEEAAAKAERLTAELKVKQEAARGERAVAKEALAVRTAQSRRAALARAVPNRLDLRLLWQTPQTLEASIRALQNALDLPDDGGFSHPALDRNQPFTLTWTTDDEYTVRLRCLKLTNNCATVLGVRHRRARPDGLPLPAAIEARRAAIAQLIGTDRMVMVSAGMQAESEAVLSLVELGDRGQFKAIRGDDPKFALRLGCADVGVLTQFIHTTDSSRDLKDLAMRAASSWADGFRQLGVRVWPQHTVAGRVPDDLSYLALWMVKRRKDTKTCQKAYVPVVVLLQPGKSSSGEVRILGWDPDADAGSGKWVSYPQMLLQLTKHAETTEDPDYVELLEGGKSDCKPDRNYLRDEQRQETYHLIQKILQTQEVHRKPVVLLVCGQNSRSYWDWQQDRNLIMDRIRTGNAPAARLPVGLRVIRLRTNDGWETPQWWVKTRAGQPNGLAAGLWLENSTGASESDQQVSATRIFYSTTEKPATARASAVGADRLVLREKKLGKDKGGMMVDTNQNAWNPMLLEIAVVGCQNDSKTLGFVDMVTPSVKAGVPTVQDDPEALALAVHQLRQAPDYLAPLLLPLPLHLAKLVGDYVLPTSKPDLDRDELQDELEVLSENAGMEIYEQQTLF